MPQPKPTSSTPCARSRTRSCTARSSTSTWSGASRSTGDRVGVTVAADRRRAARSGPRSPGGSPTPSARWPGVDAGRRRPHGHDRRASAPALAPAAPRRRRHATASDGARAPPNPFTDSRTRVLAIASGKGGVGKSSVTTNLAVALAQRGHKVAAVDADVWGFSMPRMLGIDRPPTVIDDVIVPPEANGVHAHLDGLLRPRGPAGRLARPDAAQGARAVPHRRALGRARLPRRRHAARHRRHRAVDGAVPPARRGRRRHHAAARGAEGRAARPRTWRAKVEPRRRSA